MTNLITLAVNNPAAVKEIILRAWEKGPIRLCELDLDSLEGVICPELGHIRSIEVNDVVARVKPPLVREQDNGIFYVEGAYIAKFNLKKFYHQDDADRLVIADCWPGIGAYEFKLLPFHEVWPIYEVHMK